ncbi:fatty-acid amide hydrolase 2-A [Trichonephila inaurata madagascariensis]|uniref:Fatty-acid amide hydrolase 2-A n=1 Tax=Trichonephila inaurata madagascariensis TaxID=2747483 RepID=A0A8X7C702_9ARAC|nr:fatty-acid amide hydrolase 2-A [Trichonephila inaurata madagascariensis]
MQVKAPWEVFKLDTGTDVWTNLVCSAGSHADIFVRYTLKKGNAFFIFRIIAHLLFAVWFGGKGKTVPPVENPLLLKSATKLAEEIREGKLKSEDVIEAYIDRISVVEPYINATVERSINVALKEAREVDSLIASGKYTKEQLAEEKPLLGVPFSVKLLFNCKGGESSLIGAGGSVIGLGNDILGSVRNPAHFCGIFGHKATHGINNFLFL